MKQKPKNAPSGGEALAHQKSIGTAARRPAEETMTYGQFSGPGLKALNFQVAVSRIEDVPAALYEYVKLQAERNVRCMDEKRYFRAEDLIGAAAWNAFSDDERAMAALCIAHIYQSGALLLGSSGFGLTYPASYYLTSGVGQKLN